MDAPITANSRKQQSLNTPQALAFLAAILFTLSSGTLNVLYGLTKGSDALTSTVWCALAVATSIIFALSWPALIRSLETRRWSAAMMALVALLLAGAYSVSAALGSAAGGRANATIAETATTDARQKLQATYDLAKAELASLKPTKPVAELEALKASWHQRMGKREPWFYDADLARAKRRAELEQKIERATADLAKITPARQANSDAKALARYLSAVGIDASPERLNDLLVVLAILLIEAGGGLSLAVGLSLVQSRSEIVPTVEQNRTELDHHTPPEPQAAPEPAKPRIVAGSSASPAALGA